MKGGIYSDSEDAKVRTLFGRGFSDEQISQKLPGRTAKSVERRRARLELRRDPQDYASPSTFRPYSDSELEVIRAERKKGKTHEEIAAMLPGRKAAGVKDQYRKRGIVPPATNQDDVVSVRFFLGEDDEDIGRETGIDPARVKRIRLRLGLSRSRLWTTKEDWSLIRLRNKGLTRKQIAASIKGRDTEASIGRRISRLREKGLL